METSSIRGLKVDGGSEGGGTRWRVKRHRVGPRRCYKSDQESKTDKEGPERHEVTGSRPYVHPTSLRISEEPTGRNEFKD